MQGGRQRPPEASPPAGTGLGAARVPSTVNIHRGINAHLQLSLAITSGFVKLYSRGADSSLHPHAWFPLEDPCPLRWSHFQGSPKEAFFSILSSLVTKVKFSYKH